MRNVPSYIADRLKKNIQTRANNSAPSARIWISRPSTVLLNDELLERQTVVNSSATDVSIAVSHPRMRRSNASIFMAYISGGVARVVTAMHKLNMNAHNWSDTGFERNASAVSIAFDGTMPRVYGSDVEFVTETEPWVFWVDSSVLHAQKVYSSDDPIVLAEENCTDVSAVRAMWSSEGGFDFGLVAFFILEGKLYYRQLIGGEWKDAEAVSFGPAGVTWAEVSASRTWDYRVVVQAKSTDGHIYELFTQFMGVGKQMTEHLAVGVEAKANNIAVDYTTLDTDEHITATVNPSAQNLYAWSSKPVSAINVDDGTGNYGTMIHLTLDYPVTKVDTNATSFVLTDGNGFTYGCSAAITDDAGTTLILTFVDFNQAAETALTIGYIPGTVMSPAVALEAFSFTFIPINLEAPDLPVPEVESIWNE